MISPLTDVVELSSRLGRVGSIQAWNPWESLRSREHLEWWIAKIASISYGRDEAANPANLFNKLAFQVFHLGCFEHTPLTVNQLSIGFESLPGNSLRQVIAQMNCSGVKGFPSWVLLNDGEIAMKTACNPVFTFLVEAPITVFRQWFRSRSISQHEMLGNGMEGFAINEMSRRYVSDSKVPFSFYGEDLDEETREYYASCIAFYDKLITKGQPPELARNCIPVGAMSKAWVSATIDDWEWFCYLRRDSHAMAEIKVFADWISEFINQRTPKFGVDVVCR